MHDPSAGRLRPTLCAIAGLLLAACSDSEHTAMRTDPVPVVVASVERKAIALEVDAVGAVEPINTVQVRSQVDGQLLSAAVRDGQDVAAGDLLFRIDPRPIQAELEQARAALARDHAQLDEANAQLKRYEPMASQGYVSADQMVQVRTTAEVAEAALKVDEANIRGLELQLGYTEIRAPIAGRIGRVLVQPGNVVQVSDSNPLVVLNQIAPIYVGFALPQRFLAGVQAASVDDPLAVTVGGEGIEGMRRGELAFVDNAVDAATGTVRMHAQFANEDHALWPGEFVTVTLNLGDEADRIVVPEAAVQVGPNGTYVFVVTDDKAEQRTVDVARTQDGESVIASGLEAGERVVVDGQSRLADGSFVSITRSAS
jgi:multidrug efflux system membrane fusion protein